MSTSITVTTPASLRREALTAYLCGPDVWTWREFPTATVAHGAGIVGAIATDAEFTTADLQAAMAVLCEQGITTEREVAYDCETGADIWYHVNPDWRNVAVR